MLVNRCSNRLLLKFSRFRTSLKRGFTIRLRFVCSTHKRKKLLTAPQEMRCFQWNIWNSSSIYINSFLPKRMAKHRIECNSRSHRGFMLDATPGQTSSIRYQHRWKLWEADLRIWHKKWLARLQLWTPQWMTCKGRNLKPRWLRWRRVCLINLAKYHRYIEPLICAPKDRSTLLTLLTWWTSWSSDWTETRSCKCSPIWTLIRTVCLSITIFATCLPIWRLLLHPIHRSQVLDRQQEVISQKWLSNWRARILRAKAVVDQTL